MSGLFDRATEPMPVVAFGGIPLKRLRQTHPSLDCGYVARLHALYKGGCALLENDHIMREVFPKHAHETDASYNERRARAYYENNFAQVINRVVAGLAQDPIQLQGERDAETGKPGDLEDYWHDLQKDATPPGQSARKTLDKIIRDAVCEALVARRAWMLIDMPPQKLAANLAEQTEAGALDAYPVMYRADQVTDWCMKDERFVWVRSCSCEYPADDPAQERGASIETWTYWSSTGWAQYKLRLDAKGKSQGTKGIDDGKEPDPEKDVILPEVIGAHQFGMVPWVMLDVCDDEEQSMWLGDMLESQARNLMNEQCGEVYLRLCAMFQQLYEFLGAEMSGIETPIPEAQTDTARARRRRGPGIVQERGKDDKAQYVAPDMASAEITLKAITGNRDGMFRVTGQMALSQDTKGAMLKRSGDSKKQDKVETEIALGVVGKLALAFGEALVEMIALGRKDDFIPECAGYAEFDVSDAEMVIEQSTEVEALTIPSATFKRELAMRAAKAALGPEMTSELADTIRDELEDTITQDAVAAAHNAPLIAAAQAGKSDDEGGEPKPPVSKPPGVGASA